LLLNILYKICIGLIFFLVTITFFMHILNIGSYTEPSLSFSYEELSPIIENTIAYKNDNNM